MVMGTAATIRAPQRDWMDVGRRFLQEKAGRFDRAEIETQIEGLTWTSEKSGPMMPVLGINECIKELRLPKVSAWATDGAITVPDPPEGSAYYSIYGIEANYSNGRARLYVLDTGGSLVPLCADFWPREEATG